MEFNTKIQVFPNVILANNLGFKEEEFLRRLKKKRRQLSIILSASKL